MATITKVLISGSSGQIGTAFCNTLVEKGGYDIYKLVRREIKNQNEVFWDPSENKIDSKRVAEISPEVVVHLAGKNLFAEKWTEKHKEEMRSSRVGSTQLLASTLAHLSSPPRVFISSSGVLYYGNSPGVTVDESSPAGTTSFCQVTKDWESACDALNNTSTRIVKLRFGLVLNAKEGMLAQMIPQFKMGLGATIGDGKKDSSWISIKDTIDAMIFCMDKKEIEGPVNVVAPNSVTGSEFTQILAKVLSRPAFLWMPEFLLKFFVGKEAAEDVILVSVKAAPKKLLDNGFKFKHEILEEALQSEIYGK